MSDLQQRVITAAILLLLLMGVLFGVFVPVYGLLLVAAFVVETLRTMRLLPASQQPAGRLLQKAMLFTFALEAFVILSSLLLAVFATNTYSARSWSPPILLFYNAPHSAYAAEMLLRVGLLASVPYLWLMVGYFLVVKPFQSSVSITIVRSVWALIGLFAIGFLWYQSILYPALRIASAYYWFDKVVIIVLALIAWEWWRLLFCRFSEKTDGHHRFVPGVVAAIILGAFLLTLDFLINDFSNVFKWHSFIVVSLWVVFAILLITKRAVYQQPAMKWALALFVPNALIAVYRAMSIAITSPPFLFLLGIIALVWVADIGAYFCGKRFGKHKLAIQISPGKTWEGAIGAVLLCLIYALIVSMVSGSYFSLVLDYIGYAGLVAWVCFLVAFSILGDLFESQLKRQSGYKDSSQILPGHGGFYDRMDALLPVLPIALILLEINWLTATPIHRMFSAIF